MDKIPKYHLVSYDCWGIFGDEKPFELPNLTPVGVHVRAIMLIPMFSICTRTSVSKSGIKKKAV